MLQIRGPKSKKFNLFDIFVIFPYFFIPRGPRGGSKGAWNGVCTRSEKIQSASRFEFFPPSGTILAPGAPGGPGGFNGNPPGAPGDSRNEPGGASPPRTPLSFCEGASPPHTPPGPRGPRGGWGGRDIHRRPLGAPRGGPWRRVS